MKFATVISGMFSCNVALVAAALAAGVGPAAAQDFNDAMLIDAAKAEGGTLNAYLASEYDFLVNGFKAQYPWATINYTQLGAGASASRLLLELSSGTYQADVAGSVSARVPEFIANKYLAAVKVPNDAGYPAGIQDPGGFTHPMILSIGAIGFNSALVPAGPATVAELADPKWKGALVMDDPALGGAMTDILATQRTVMGDEAWEKWLLALKANEPMIVRGGGESYAAVLSGERTLCICQVYDILNGAAGSPVSFTPYNQDTSGMIAAPVVALSPNKAPHPAMAALFLNWLVSPEGGQAGFCKVNRLPAVPVPGCTIKLGDNVKITTTSAFEDYYSNPKKYTDKFKAIFD